jgi:hypothetical protein
MLEQQGDRAIGANVLGLRQTPFLAFGMTFCMYYSLTTRTFPIRQSDEGNRRRMSIDNVLKRKVREIRESRCVGPKNKRD